MTLECSRQEVQVDSACVYIKAGTDAAFEEELRSLEAQGLLGRWRPGATVKLHGPGDWTPLPAEEHEEQRLYVGTPSMESFVATLPAAVAVCQAKVLGLVRSGTGWVVESRAGDAVKSQAFEAVVLALPALDAAALWPELPKHLPEPKRLERDFMKARFSLVAALASRPSTPFKIALPQASAISLAYDWSSRPSRAALPTFVEAIWVAQTSTEWAAEHLHAEEPAVESELLAELLRLLAMPPGSVLASRVVHWCYGDMNYEVPLGHVHSVQELVACAGDWCFRGRVEGAWLSGKAAGAAVCRDLGL